MDIRILDVKVSVFGGGDVRVSVVTEFFDTESVRKCCGMSFTRMVMRRFFREQVELAIQLEEEERQKQQQTNE